MSPRKIEILLLEGTPFGLRYADIKTMTIRAFVCPRASFKDLLARPELENSGVYILFDKATDSELPKVYIGEADVLKDRLPHHASKDFWTEIIVFVAQDETLDKAGVRYIESMLVSRSKQDKLVQLENGNIPAIKNISEANQAVMNEVVEDIIFLLSVLGYRVIRPSAKQIVESSQPLLHLTGAGQSATGRETDEGFIVCKGSTARQKTVPSLSAREKKLRETLINIGVLVTSENTLQFSQDYVFSSPSMAGKVVLGRSVNGRTMWKNKVGKTLKEIQEA